MVLFCKFDCGGCSVIVSIKQVVQWLWLYNKLDICLILSWAVLLLHSQLHWLFLQCPDKMALHIMPSCWWGWCICVQINWVVTWFKDFYVIFFNLTLSIYTIKIHHVSSKYLTFCWTWYWVLSEPMPEQGFILPLPKFILGLKFSWKKKAFIGNAFTFEVQKHQVESHGYFLMKDTTWLCSHFEL